MVDPELEPIWSREWMAPGDPASAQYLDEVVSLRGDVDAATVRGFAAQLHSSRIDVYREIAVRLAAGWTIADTVYELRAIA